jgi:hypothetical protein
MSLQGFASPVNNDFGVCQPGKRRFRSLTSQQWSFEMFIKLANVVWCVYRGGKRRLKYLPGWSTSILEFTCLVNVV